MLRKLQTTLFFLFTLSLFSQVGKHFWPEFALVSGIRVDYLSPTLYLSDLLVTGLIVVLFLRMGPASSHPRPTSSMNLRALVGGPPLRVTHPLVPLVLLLITQLFIVQIVQSHLYGALKLAELVFVVFYVKRYIKDLIRPFILALAIGSVFSSLLAIAQFIHQGSFQSVLYFVGERLYSVSTIGIASMRIGDNSLVRPYAAFPHPNVLAYALIFSSIYLVYFFPLFKRKYLIGVILGIIQIGILVTFSRVLILLYLCWVAYFLFKHFKGKWVLAGASMIGLFSFVYGLLYKDRFIDLLTRPKDLLLRVESIQNAFEIIKQNWLIGTGLNNYFYYLIDIQKNFSPVFLQPAHNIFVLILVQTGILGFVLFATFLFQIFVRLSNGLKTADGLNKRFYQATMAVLIITLVSGMFDHFMLTVQQGQLFGAVLIGLAWSSTTDLE